MKTLISHYVLFCFFCLYSFTSLNAQNSIEKEATSICNCISKKKTYTINELENAFEDCAKDILTNANDDDADKIRIYLSRNCKPILDHINNEQSSQFYEEDRTPINPIIGSYSLTRGSQSPEGGTNMFVFQPDFYLITYFGGAQLGKVKVYNNEYAQFIPLKKETPFTVHGRHNTQLKDSTKMVFVGDGVRNNTFVHFSDIHDDSQFYPLYNSDANCVSYPSIKRLKGKTNKIALTYIRYEDALENEVYEFKNPERYNDFIIRYHESFHENGSRL